MAAARMAPAGPAGAQFQARDIVLAFAMYVSIAVALIWTGIGSIRARRWVPPIVTVFSTIILAVGILAMVALVVTLPSMQTAVQASIARSAPAMPRSAMTTGIAFVAIFVTAVIYVILPGVYLWFYRRPSLREVVEFYDPTPRWTDRVPVPVLGLSLGTALGGFWSLFNLAYLVLPAFGTLLIGAPAAVAVVLVAAACAFASVFIYRQRTLGWWMAVGIASAGTLSGVITWLRTDPVEMFEAMQLQPQQIEMMRNTAAWRPALLIPITLVGYGAVLAFAIYVRRRFPFNGRSSMQGADSLSQ
jgi:hypothetical protein